MVWSRYPKPPEPTYPRSVRAIKALLALVAALAIALLWQNVGRATPDNIASVAAPDQSGERINVTSVHDGDTFRIGDERIRILGMDAPEIGNRAQCAAEQRAAERARDYLKAALVSPTLRIERDGYDVYGRTLAYVYVDGRDVAAQMLAAGLAKPYVPRHHGDWC